MIPESAGVILSTVRSELWALPRVAQKTHRSQKKKNISVFKEVIMLNFLFAFGPEPVILALRDHSGGYSGDCVGCWDWTGFATCKANVLPTVLLWPLMTWKWTHLHIFLICWINLLGKLMVFMQTSNFMNLFGNYWLILNTLNVECHLLETKAKKPS